MPEGVAPQPQTLYSRRHSNQPEGTGIIHNTARSILSFVCLVGLIVGVLGWVGWADTPDWVGHFFSGFAVAALIAFIGSPVKKRTTRPVTPPVNGQRVTVTKRDER